MHHRAGAAAIFFLSGLALAAGWPVSHAQAQVRPAQGAGTQARPTVPPWNPGQNPVEPICAMAAGEAGSSVAASPPAAAATGTPAAQAATSAAAQLSPAVVFEVRDNKVYLVIQSRPSDTVAVVTHETGAISFDRPVCIVGVDAIVTRPSR